MPLEHAKSDEARSRNIAELIRAGHDPKQAEAIAYRVQREASDARAAGALLTAPSGRALFVRRSDKARDHQGEWCCPGGSIEAGETPEQAAHRETQEETGYSSGDLTQIDEGDGFVTFRANVDTEFDPKLNDEHTEFRWAPMDAPPAPMHPGVLATLKKLVAKAAESGKRETQAEREAAAAGAAETEAQRQAQALLGAQDKREIDTNGWYEVLDNPLSGVGVFEYAESSVVPGGDRRKMVGVYRPEKELANPETIESFRLMPWTDDHPDSLLGPEEKGLVPAEEKGVHGVIGEKTYFRDGTLFGNIKVFSQKLARKIAAGKRELSVGYHCQFIPQEGVFEGKPYQYVQTNIRGNHLASVGKGKMGNRATVQDAAERLCFALDVREPAMRDDEQKDCLDADTRKFIEDSFGSLVGELERKGYSKQYATKVAGKVAAEKGMTGHHDTAEDTQMADSTKGDVKDPAGKEEDPSKKGDLEPQGKAGGGGSKDKRDARDAKRSARDARRAKDMTSEEEEGEDAAECADDAEEEKEDEKDESSEARDRRSARDRRAGARDARKHARDRAARDSKGKGMDASEVTALVRTETAKAVTDAAAAGRRDAFAAQKLYGRLSPIIGAFDHDEMSLADMAAYGLKKLGAPEAKDPVTALDYYLAGRGTRATARTAAQDSAPNASFMDKYLSAA